MDSAKKGKSRLLARLEATEPDSFRSWQRFMRMWPEIHDALEQGYTIRAIHAALVAGGDWSSGYDVFRRYIPRAKRLPAGKL